VRELEARIEASRRALGRLRGVEADRLRTVVAPYRVCPIGAHVDHQHGPVLGLAIGAWTLLSFAPSGGSAFGARFPDLAGAARFVLVDPEDGVRLS
jgi:galacturonokinase